MKRSSYLISIIIMLSVLAGLDIVGVVYLHVPIIVIILASCVGLVAFVRSVLEEVRSMLQESD